jgi:hypothetical protein
MTNQRKVVYYASELAACVGMNRFTEPWQAAVKIWQRIKPKEFSQAVATLQGKGRYRPEETAKETEQWLARSGALDAAKSAVTCEQAELKGTLVAAIKASGADANPDMEKSLRKWVYTSRGDRAENPALDAYESIKGCAIPERNSRFRLGTFEAADGSHISVGGKVDGLSATGELVEVKNRQRKILQYIPLHERVQMHAYMFLTGTKECTLVQTCGDDTQSTAVPLDEALWRNVQEQLTAFDRKLGEVMCCQERQRLLLSDGVF